MDGLGLLLKNCVSLGLAPKVSTKKMGFYCKHPEVRVCTQFCRTHNGI